MLKTRERDSSRQIRLNSIKSRDPRSSNMLKARSTDFCHPGIVGKKKGGRKDEGAGDDMAREMLRAAAHAVANKAKRGAAVRNDGNNRGGATVQSRAVAAVGQGWAAGGGARWIELMRDENVKAFDFCCLQKETKMQY